MRFPWLKLTAFLVPALAAVVFLIWWLSPTQVVKRRWEILLETIAVPAVEHTRRHRRHQHLVIAGGQYRRHLLAWNFGQQLLTAVRDPVQPSRMARPDDQRAIRHQAPGHDHRLVHGHSAGPQG